ncbi:MAG: hypothetical protein IH616_00300 [Gemmatimonadales bacterium]|nr:hypothetical protein [Gemmatimonadales bacterium]
MATASSFCLRCESSLARLCFDVAAARWYVHCFECGSEREIHDPYDFRRPETLPVFLSPMSVAHWRRAIEVERLRKARHKESIDGRSTPTPADRSGRAGDAGRQP